MVFSEPAFPSPHLAAVDQEELGLPRLGDRAHLHDVTLLPAQPGTPTARSSRRGGHVHRAHPGRTAALRGGVHSGVPCLPQNDRTLRQKDRGGPLAASLCCGGQSQSALHRVLKHKRLGDGGLLPAHPAELGAAISCAEPRDAPPRRRAGHLLVGTVEGARSILADNR